MPGPRHCRCAIPGPDDRSRLQVDPSPDLALPRARRAAPSSRHPADAGEHDCGDRAGAGQRRGAGGGAGRVNERRGQHVGAEDRDAVRPVASLPDRLCSDCVGAFGVHATTVPQGETRATMVEAGNVDVAYTLLPAAVARSLATPMSITPAMSQTTKIHPIYRCSLGQFSELGDEADARHFYLRNYRPVCRKKGLCYYARPFRTGFV